jgi:hypothetical protein
MLVIVRFMLDTNILIPAEPTRLDDVESSTAAITTLLGLLAAGGHMSIVHPASRIELAGDRDPARAKARGVLLQKYPALDYPPGLSSRLVFALGVPRAASNSEVDLLLLSAVDANAVDYFVTEDDGIHRRANRVGLSDRVLTIADAIAMVRALFPTVPEAPPLVTPLVAHQLDDSDPIFGSFRQDYAGFDAWLVKCKREHRRAWVIHAGDRYAALCIVNDETANQYGFPGRTLKICSFKIAEGFRGYRYGELILKTVFAYLVENKYSGVFLEAFSKHQELFTLLSEFGFDDVRESSKGERVLFKQMKPHAHDAHGLGPLAFNVKYGPYAISLIGAQVFVVPIQKHFHELLFPELRTQLELATESHPFGNSIRKAYLCHSKIRRISPGDAMLFYRSQQEQGVTAVGVAEATMVSSEALAIAHFVGRRTVYSYAEIEAMASKPVLAVLFRQARGLRRRWELDLLKRAGIVRRPPQSIMQVRPEAIPWMATQLDVPH